MHEAPWVEKDVIAFMRRACAHVPESLGLLDDCAITPKCAEEVWLISQDSCVEGVHFRERFFSPAEIGYKVYHSTVSDIAAMGGSAQYISLGLSLPQGRTQSFVEALLEEFISCAKRTAVTIIGGDTTRSPGPLFLSATVIGSVKKIHLKKRSTAKAGNFLAVTGKFGYAALGLRMLDDPQLAQKYPDLIAAQKMPSALLEKGSYFGKCAAVTAMLDVSDGILKDAENLCRASSLMVHLDCQKIPLPPIVMKGADELGISALKTVLEGGEDYGLMVALDHHADSNELQQIISTGELVIIGRFSEGKPEAILENVPNSLHRDPPVIFEHGG